MFKPTMIKFAKQKGLIWSDQPKNYFLWAGCGNT